MIELCKVGCEVGVYMCVVCNILLCCVVEGILFECLKDVFVGLILIVYFMEYLGAAVCLFKEFVKVNVKFEVKVAVFEGELILVFQIDCLVILLIYEEVIVCLMVIMKEVLVGKLVCILAVVCDVKEAV